LKKAEPGQNSYSGVARIFVRRGSVTIFLITS